jgi:regulator of protease activity HflC (stomatin/prohibitin superfamily)
MATSDDLDPKTIGCFGSIAGVLVIGIACGVMFGCPQLKVYEQRLAGEAELRKAESSRQVQIEDAKAKEHSAKMLAGAEIERAKGVAEANRIIGDSLKNNPEYLTYLWIEKVNSDSHATIYVPTEAGLPILEAGRGIGRKPADKK